MLYELKAIKEELEGYENHYNKLPEGFEFTDEKSFHSDFMCYSWDYIDNKQVFDPERMDLKLFITRAFGLTVGLAFVTSWKEPMRYARFGDWKTFHSKFAAQFQGDNS